MWVWLIKLFNKLKAEETMVKLEGAATWNDRWPKNEVIYKARGRYSMDVRNLILNKSYILNKPVSNYNNLPTDKLALALLEFVIEYITYKSDESVYDKPEFWQHPEITLQMGIGDCEDGAVLLASMLRIAGVPGFRVKVCAGWVKSGGKKEGHAYVVYLADDNEWYTLDWCYWPKDSVKNFLRKSHAHNSKYREIWWTANDEYSWAQESTKI